MSFLAYELRPKVLRSFFNILKRELLLSFRYYLLILLPFLIIQLLFVLNIELMKHIFIFDILTCLYAILSTYINSYIRDNNNGFSKNFRLLNIHPIVIHCAKICAYCLIFIPACIFCMVIHYVILNN
ncbi:hypothetical protein Cyrtocomes_00896 [Candidatus Cyrtobacter comes]|uniref:Uncharacterized protein n=1 Tax=Candidatus Cyrtobacter comes TaxID=675776 RepID=A0ABU5L8R5_9RICK|nr:hypothetical protein [Candidatus Cyrtobacter comes]